MRPVVGCPGPITLLPLTPLRPPRSAENARIHCSARPVGLLLLARPADPAQSCWLARSRSSLITRRRSSCRRTSALACDSVRTMSQTGRSTRRARASSRSCERRRGTRRHRTGGRRPGAARSGRRRVRPPRATAKPSGGGFPFPGGEPLRCGGRRCQRYRRQDARQDGEAR